MCPLIKELEKRGCFDITVLAGGQHVEAVRSVVGEFGVKIDTELSVSPIAGRLASVGASVLVGADNVIKEKKPDVVLVHGDTATAHAVALAAFYNRVPIGHVEAGLRTASVEEPFPEELFRRAISLMAAVHFSPTEHAAQNLISEGRQNVFITGNTVLDALSYTVSDSYTDPLCDKAGRHPTLLVTAHRRESRGEGHREIFRAAAKISLAYPHIFVVLAAHPSPQVRESLSVLKNSRVTVCEPLGVRAFHNLLARSFAVLTDSGGVQEEAAALGVPVLVCRGVTERSEGIAAGCAELVGVACDRITDAFATLVTDGGKYKKMAAAENPYGNGTASVKIADILTKGW